MKSTRPVQCESEPRSSGFTIIELVVVIGLIGIASAIAFPPIASYLRNYTIRGAAQQVASEIQTARLQAIKKNVNYGAIFVVLTETTYQYFLEDVPLSGLQQPYPADPNQVRQPWGPIRSLPDGVFFEGGGTVPGGGKVDYGFRFNRLGAMCDPDVGTPTTCRDLALSAITPQDGNNYVEFNSDPNLLGAMIRLAQPSTGLTRELVVTYGGRAQVR